MHEEDSSLVLRLRRVVCGIVIPAEEHALISGTAQTEWANECSSACLPTTRYCPNRFYRIGGAGW